MIRKEEAGKETLRSGEPEAAAYVPYVEETMDTEMVRELIREFYHSYVGNGGKRSLSELQRRTGERLSVIGTGEHEFYKTKEEFIAEMERGGYESDEVCFSIDREEYHVEQIAPEIFMAYGKLLIRLVGGNQNYLTVDMDTRFSIVCRVIDGELEVLHIHHSIPYLDQGADQLYPQTITAKANEAIRYSKYLEKLVEQDAMTRLLNRTAVEQKVDLFLEENQGRYPLFVIDIDDFKSINDTYGHLFGDQVILEVAQVLCLVFGEQAYIGRTGGDEFVAFVARHMNEAEIQETAGQVMEELLSSSGKRQCEIHCSIGIAVSDEQMCTFGKLFAEADQMLYKSKHAGKSRFSMIQAGSRRIREGECKEEQVTERSNQIDQP